MKWYPLPTPKHTRYTSKAGTTGNERTKEGIEKAIEYFNEAIKRDPKYAQAYIGVADCYGILENWGYMPPAEASAKYREYLGKALELDDLLAEAHTALAAHLLGHEFDVEGEEREFKRAIELNPSYATAHHWCQRILGCAREARGGSCRNEAS